MNGANAATKLVAVADKTSRNHPKLRLAQCEHCVSPMQEN